MYLYAVFGLDVAETIDLINATYGDDPGVSDAISGLRYALDKGMAAVEVDKVVYNSSGQTRDDVQQLQQRHSVLNDIAILKGRIDKRSSFQKSHSLPNNVTLRPVRFFELGQCYTFQELHFKFKQSVRAEYIVVGHPAEQISYSPTAFTVAMKCQDGNQVTKQLNFDRSSRKERQIFALGPSCKARSMYVTFETADHMCVYEFTVYGEKV